MALAIWRLRTCGFSPFLELCAREIAHLCGKDPCLRSQAVLHALHLPLCDVPRQIEIQHEERHRNQEASAPEKLPKEGAFGLM
jgi:hypothetical protein